MIWETGIELGANKYEYPLPETVSKHDSTDYKIIESNFDEFRIVFIRFMLENKYDADTAESIPIDVLKHFILYIHKGRDEGWVNITALPELHLESVQPIKYLIKLISKGI